VAIGDLRTIDVAAVFTAPRSRQTSLIAENLGCTMEDGPLGPIVKIDVWE
jgi:hypothetical protein